MYRYITRSILELMYIESVGLVIQPIRRVIFSSIKMNYKFIVYCMCQEYNEQPGITTKIKGDMGKYFPKPILVSFMG